ncbi:GNAT family N-acetyltransferase [Sphaerisporangium sp. NPDC051011]|uniref:GNAT family N-acetyltransferase n=1 Tax=Sphaerisporangium sp. NPDC051011 TaxID=3155792 RepID=UPI0033E07380
MYVAQPLSQDHNLGDFDCGKEDLSDWLKKYASHAEAMRTARTFVWTRQDEAHVLAYYSIAGHAIEKAQVPPKIGRGGPEQIPAVILARLALDRQLQGQGLGSRLLIDALNRMVRASKEVAFRLVVVDAIDEEAALFYEKYGFRRIPGDMRLVRKLSDIERDLSDL